jgi:hypothetical protein
MACFPPLLRLTKAAIFIALLIPSADASAQTYSVVHYFAGADGAGPAGRLVFDSDGNLYGSASELGTVNCEAGHDEKPGARTCAGSRQPDRSRFCRYTLVGIHPGQSAGRGREQLRTTLPIRRVVGLADVAELAVHIMTNTALTGATFDIDGGQQLVEG